MLSKNYMMSPFEAYRTYLALKQHFTQKGYDYFKYNGKVNVRADNFDTRKDKYQFYKLSKHKDPINFLVANFISGDVRWVGDLLSDEAEAEYSNWLKRQQSITYNFTNDLNKLLTNFEDNLIVKDGQHPYLLKQFRRGDVAIETMVILNDLVNFFPYWDKSIDDTVLWPDLRMRVVKYKPFVQYDENKCKKALADRFDSYI